MGIKDRENRMGTKDRENRMGSKDRNNRRGTCSFVSSEYISRLFLYVVIEGQDSKTMCSPTRMREEEREGREKEKHRWREREYDEDTFICLLIVHISFMSPYWVKLIRKLLPLE